MQRQRLLIGLAGLLLAILCGGYLLLGWFHPNDGADGDAESIPNVRFMDITNRAGIRFHHFNGASGRKLLPETMGSGVAFIDYDGDGKQDILFVNSCPWPGAESRREVTLALYRNKGDGTFDDVTDACGLNITMYGMGVAVGDYDNDGFPDIFISGVGSHRLFHNEGGKRFTDVTETAGVGGGGKLPDCTHEQFLAWDSPISFGSSATFIDYDGDGRLDLFVCHYVTWSPKIDLAIPATLRGGKRAYVPPQEFEGAQCRLYRNVDGKRFEDVSAAAGVLVVEPHGPDQRHRPVAKALGVVLCDPDEDGWPDLLVANDTVRNFFFHNVPGPNGTRVFKEEGLSAGAAYGDDGRPRGGMGIDWGEYAPGKNGVLVANFASEPNTFLSLDNARPPQFADHAVRLGVAGNSRSPLKFGAFFFDYDLDGRLDLLTCNGHLEPDIAIARREQTYAQPAQLFWNTGQDDRLFEPVDTEQAGEALFRPIVGRGCAFADIDGDGDLDVVITANGQAARLLRNDQKTGHHWIRLVLVGDGKRSNVSAIGAQVTIEADGRVMKRQVTGGRGYLSQSELPLTIGLADIDKVDRVIVRWPGRDAGPPEMWRNLQVDRPCELRQGTGRTD